jgi:hypothetical protein
MGSSYWWIGCFRCMWSIYCERMQTLAALVLVVSIQGALGYFSGGDSAHGNS